MVTTTNSAAETSALSLIDCVAVSRPLVRHPPAAGGPRLNPGSPITQRPRRIDSALGQCVADGCGSFGTLT